MTEGIYEFPKRKTSSDDLDTDAPEWETYLLNSYTSAND